MGLAAGSVAFGELLLCSPGGLGPLHVCGMSGSTCCFLLSLQLGANALLFVGVNMYGVFVRILTERSQRKAFLQARSCIEDRLRLEDENEKQVSGLGQSA